MFTDLSERIVAFSARHYYLVVAIVAILTAASAFSAVQLFRINTDIEKLIDSRVQWRQDEISFDRAFPNRANIILAVVDGQTPESAEKAAADLARVLTDRRDLIESVYRPDGGEFFKRNGLLLMPYGEVVKNLDQLVRRQGLLGPLAADPSLRGLSRLLVLAAEGVETGETTLADLEVPMKRIGATIEKTLAGEAAPLSWQLLLAGGEVSITDLRKFVLIRPVLHSNALEAGVAATQFIREAAGKIGLNTGDGARMRLTGPIVVSDEEFATIADDAGLNYGVTGVAVLVLLWMAVRSVRLVAAVLLTTAAGLVVTAALGLAMVGEFNPISAAFAALFVGLGIDFGIQFAVRYRVDRQEAASTEAALRGTARGIGWSLALAAFSLLSGFFAFLPTSFRGVSELGLVAGSGMMVAYLLALTLLPAFIAILKPDGGTRVAGFGWLSGVDPWVVSHRKSILLVVWLCTGLATPLLWRLPFDANPMNLRSEKAESIATYLDLVKDPATSPNVIDVLARSVDEVPNLSKRLLALPTVASVVSIETFVPDDQERKLVAISAAADLLEPVLYPVRRPAPPTDREEVEALKKAAAALHVIADPAAARSAFVGRFADALSRLAEADISLRKKASLALTSHFVILLDNLRSLLAPTAITLDRLPERLKQDWVAEDGRARIEVHPKGDSNDDLTLRNFVQDVRTVAPDATGAPVAATASSRTILWAFAQAAGTAFVLIFVILSVALGSPREVVMTLTPLVLATLWTLMSLPVIGMPLNFANIIALPLMLAVGVAFHIYYVVAWRAGVVDALASSLTRAILFSSLTTGAAFGSLMLSSHPGTASMGKLLALSLFFTMVAAFFVVPAFLGPPRSAATSRAEHRCRNPATTDSDRRDRTNHLRSAGTKEETRT